MLLSKKNIHLFYCVFIGVAIPNAELDNTRNWRATLWPEKYGAVE